jgi:hypothetical protein
MNSPRTIFLLLILSSSLCLASAPGGLSQADEKAYRTIATSERFCGTAVGIAGTTPEVVIAFRKMLKSPSAARAFKGLLADASRAGKLYALCGFYYADPDYFDEAVKRFQGSSDEVETLMGCIGSRATVGSIVASRSPKVVRLKNREQTVREWAEETKASEMVYDIIGGGWPSMFKNSGGYRSR